MRKTTVVAALALAALLLGAIPAARACPGANVPAGSQPTAAASNAVVCLINHGRSAHGLRPLRGSASLWTAAQAHSDAMDALDFFSHYGSDGAPAARAAAAGYTEGARDWEVGENLGYGETTAGSPKGIVRAWMRSPRHRKVLLEPFWRQIGVGITQGSPLGPDLPSMSTFTVNFGYRRR